MNDCANNSSELNPRSLTAVLAAHSSSDDVVDQLPRNPSCSLAPETEGSLLQPAAKLTEWQVLVRSAVNGEILCSVRLEPTTCVQQAVEERIPDLMPFKLVHDGKACEPGKTTLDFGLTDQSLIDLVCLPNPKHFRLQACLDLIKLGYHMHDTYMDRIPCRDENFYLAWNPRGMNPSLQKHYTGVLNCKGLPKEPPDDVIVTLDATNVSKSRISEAAVMKVRKKLREIAKLKARPAAELDNLQRRKLEGEADFLAILGEVQGAYPPTSKTLDYSAVLRFAHVNHAVDNWPRLLAVDNEEQMLILEQGRHGGSRIRRVKNSCEPCKVLHEFAERIAQGRHDCCFVGDSLYLVGVLDTNETCLWELAFSADGQLHERRCAVQEVHGEQQRALGRPWHQPWAEHNYVPKFLGLDVTGEALWMKTWAGLHVVPLESLEGRQCLLWDGVRAARAADPEEFLSRQVAFDLQSRELFVFWDRSLARHQRVERINGKWGEVVDNTLPTCEIYCLSPSQKDSSTSPWDAQYADLQGSLVCTADFGVDQYSDCFCVAEVHVAPQSRSLMVLDARDALWSMHL